MQTSQPEHETVTAWTEVGIWDRIPQGVNSRHHCPRCTPHRKHQNQRDRDFVIAPNGEVGQCHHCGYTVNIRTRGTGEPRPLPTPPASSYAAPQAFLPPGPVSLPSDEAKNAYKPILEQRGLSLELLEQDFGVTFTWRQDMGHTMVIPCYDPQTGEVCNHKYRGINKEFRNDTGTKRPMYNLHRVKDADVIVIVEGEMDVFALNEAGFPHAISVPDGAPVPNASNVTRSMAYLEEAIPFLEKASRVIIAVDNDPPGDFLRKELENRIGVGNVAHIRFPEGVKDANDALINLGKKWLWEQIASARPAPISGVFTPMDMLAEIDHALKYGFDTGTPIGYPSLDQIYRPTAGHLTIITGHAGSGKSTVLDNMIVSLAERHMWATAYFSPEQMPLERHLFSLAEIYLDKPVIQSRADRYGMECANREEVLRFIDFINPFVSHLSPEMAGDTPSLDRILELATAEVRRNGIKGLVLDPWNEIEVARPTHITETEWVSIALGKIRRWARTHNVHVWLVAHPRKMRTDEGMDAVPGLGDISGSNNFRNKADYGLTIYGDRSQQLIPGNVSTVTIRVTKSRWRDSAITNGEATFIYNPATNRISEPLPTFVQQVRPQLTQNSLY